MRTIVGGLLASLALSVHGTSPPSGIQVPPGFRVETFARGLSQPTAMAYGPDGRIYVTESTGRVVAVTRGTTHPVVLVRGLRTPLGLVWRGSMLFVSEQGRLEHFVLSGGRLGGRHVIVKGIPFGEHQQDNVVVGADGRLYWGSGPTGATYASSRAASATRTVLRCSRRPVASTPRSTARTSSAPTPIRSRPRWSSQ